MIKRGRSSGHKFVWGELDRCARSVVTVNSPSAASRPSSETVNTWSGSDGVGTTRQRWNSDAEMVEKPDRDGVKEVLATMDVGRR